MLKKFFPFSRKGKITMVSAVCVVAVGLCSGIWAVSSEQKNIVVAIDGQETPYVTYAHTVGDFLAEKNIILGEKDKMNVSLEQTLEDKQRLEIRRCAEVSILVDGKTLHLSDLDITVAEALEQAGVTLGQYDTVEPGLEVLLAKGMVIDVDRVEIKEEIREIELAYSVEKKRDSTLDVGTEKVVIQGVPGKQIDTYRVFYHDGKLSREELLSSKVEEPINKVVITGGYDVASRSGNKTATAPKNSTATQGGTAPQDKTAKYAPNGMKYTKTFTVKATAYTHDGTKTKMGTECRVGAIAVDPSVIPLGSRLYVEGYGYCTAEDTGGKIKGNRIDVFLDTEAECVNWGVRSVVIYILE